MKAVFSACALLVLLGLPVPAEADTNTAATEPTDLALCHVRLVDVGEASVGAPVALLIRDSVVSGVIDSCEGLQPAVQQLDYRGHFVIPGLWDMHVHALWHEDVVRAFLPRFVRWGVTGIRDMGGNLRHLESARAWGAAGAAIPEIIAAGPVLDGPQPVDASISIALTDEQDVGPALDTLQSGRADFAKTYSLLPRDVFFELVKQANQRGLPAAGHVPASVEPIEAIESGLASIEHMRDEIEPLCHPPEAACEVLAKAMLSHGTYLTPTLAVLDKTPLLDPAGFGGQEIRALPAIVRDYWSSSRDRALAQGRAYRKEREQRYARAVAQLRTFFDAGVPVLAGSDAGNPVNLPGQSLHRELALLVDAGLSPAQALATATLVPRRFLHRSEAVFSPGAPADFVILSGNPLADIHNTRRVAGTLRAGQLILPDSPSP